MSNAGSADAFLRGEIDASQYWRESGEQQVKSAGVFLTESQQQRALKSLDRLASSLRQAGVSKLTYQVSDRHNDALGDEFSELQLAFDRRLAAYK